MKLLLTSSGFTNKAIIDAFESLVGKNAKDISIAVINEAYAVEHSDHSWVIDELSQIRQTIGGDVEIVDLLANDTTTVRERILQHDAIFVLGGHTDYLMSLYQKTGFDTLLTELLETKVYVGSSAGSMVLCNRISSAAYQEIYGEKANYDVSQYMELVDIAIKPHLDSDHFPNNRKEKLLEISKTYDGTLYALSDESALYVNGETIEVVGDHWLKLTAGDTVQRG